MPIANFETNLKICSGCNQILPIESFYKDNQKKDGLSCRCKECTKIQKPWQNYYNLEKISSYRRRRWKEDEEYRKRSLEQYKSYIKTEKGHKKKLDIQREQNLKRKLNNKQNDWIKNKRKTDPFFAISQRYRARLNNCFKKNGISSVEILGCS